MINVKNILKHLNNKLAICVYDVIPSTNDEARQYLLKQPCDRAVFVARGKPQEKGGSDVAFIHPRIPEYI